MSFKREYKKTQELADGVAHVASKEGVGHVVYNSKVARNYVHRCVTPPRSNYERGTLWLCGCGQLWRATYDPDGSTWIRCTKLRRRWMKFRGKLQVDPQAHRDMAEEILKRSRPPELTRGE